MRADDPRHGTYAGYCAGCREMCCRRAVNDYARHLRTRQYLAGGPLKVPAVGTKRRIRALMALGWSSRVIDAELGREWTYAANLLCGPDTIHRNTAELVAGVYERLSMRLPDERVKPGIVTRTRNHARRNGWAPPLAWDNIDDPDEQPTDWHYQAVDRAAVLRDLVDMGLGITEAARRLHTSRGALEKWCARNGMSDVYRHLAAREALGENQHTREGAA